MPKESSFKFIAAEMEKRFGLITPIDATMAMRLAPLARRGGFGDVDAFAITARAHADDGFWLSMADALAPVDTHFFNSRALFAQLRDEILPDLFARKGARARIWCVGASSGQEAYSLAMLIEDVRAQGAAGADILATDLSGRQIEKGRAGVYTQFEVQRGLPIRKLVAHFEKVGEYWRISERMRANVHFAQHNLMNGAQGYGPFDLVLCANVLGWMSPAGQKAAISAVAEASCPDAVLVLANGEALPEGLDGFAAGAAGNVLKRGAAQRAAA